MTIEAPNKTEQKDYQVLIVEDHHVVRTGIKFMLKSLADEYIFTTDETDNEKETLQKINANNYDIVLLDIELNGDNGLEILKKIKSYNKNIKVIILTMYNDILTINKALKNKANGYMLKNLLEEEILEAIKTVLNDKIYICKEAAQIIKKEEVTSTKENLSKREIEIVRYVAKGLSNVEIGQELGLSHRTIDTHKQNIYQKLGINKNIDLVKYAIQNKLA